MREPQPVTLESVLRVLSKDRLVRLGRNFDVAVTRDVTREAQVRTLLASGRLAFADLLRSLGRDELKAACRAHHLDASGRARSVLARQLADTAGEVVAVEGVAETGVHLQDGKPKRGDVVQARQRQYLVDDVTPPPGPGDATHVRLVCLDDDNQGKIVELLWELELGRPERLDPPQLFAAYLHALRWNAVTATEKLLFQAPFRAGIALSNLHHQLIPLMKALDLPRANLLIADDVGLGKTIEAGLIVQELRWRQRLDLVVVVCPAAICLQWKGEMARRFGLHFEIYNRAFVAQRSRERGAAVNPWTTHNRFNRRFKPSRKQLERVMVRRLKEDLRQAGLGDYPDRRVREIALENDDGRWSCTYRDRGKDGGDQVVYQTSLGDDLESDAELRLSELLAEYTQLLSPGRGPGRLVFIRLQKRLLSSIRALDRTLARHAEKVSDEVLVDEALVDEALVDQALDEEADEYGDEEAADVARTALRSRAPVDHLLTPIEAAARPAIGHDRYACGVPCISLFCGFSSCAPMISGLHSLYAIVSRRPLSTP